MITGISGKDAKPLTSVNEAARGLQLSISWFYRRFTIGLCYRSQPRLHFSCGPGTDLCVVGFFEAFRIAWSHNKGQGDWYYRNFSFRFWVDWWVGFLWSFESDKQMQLVHLQSYSERNKNQLHLFGKLEQKEMSGMAFVKSPLAIDPYCL